LDPYLVEVAKHPHKLGLLVGKDKLTEMHSEWIKYIWLSDENKSLLAHRGSYKDIDVTEPVLTPSGFKAHGELLPGNLVYSPSGKTVQITGVSEVFHNPCFAVTFSDGHVVKCGEGHLWEVGQCFWNGHFQTQSYMVRSTKELKEFYDSKFMPHNRLLVKAAKIVEDAFGKKIVIPSTYKTIVSITTIDSIPTNCVKVDSEDGLYLVGRELTATHNTTAITEIGCVWWLLFHPDDRIAIIRDNFTEASKTMKTVCKYIKDPNIQTLFYLAHGYYPKSTVNKANLTLYNFKKTVTKEGSLNAHGMDSVPTGSHYDKIICDDFITLEDRLSKAKREKTKEGILEVITNIIDPGKQVGFVGTPWHKDDGWKLCPAPLIYNVYQTGLLSEEEIAKKKKTTTSSLYAANYELKHESDEKVLFKDPQYACWVWGCKDVIGHIDAKFDGDHTGAVTFMGLLENGKCQVTGWIFREHIKEKITWLKELLHKYQVTRLHIEVNPDKGMVADLLKKELPMGRPIVEPYQEDMNKHYKITFFLKEFWGNLFFDENLSKKDSSGILENDYMNQILDYKEGAELCDGPDSLASCCRRGFYADAMDAAALALYR